jgi:hypothetical protein
LLAKVAVGDRSEDHDTSLQQHISASAMRSQTRAVSLRIVPPFEPR